MQTVTKDFPNGETVEFGDNFIMHCKGFFDDELCDTFIDYWHTVKAHGQILLRGEYDTNDQLRKSDTSTANYPDLPPTEEARFSDLTSDFVRDIHENIIPLYAENYFQELNGAVRIWDCPKIQRTVPGEGYHQWHCETFGRQSRDRVLAYMLYLNDVDEGGETEFLYQHCRYKPLKGDLLIWPGYFTHVHRGNPPLSGHKYIATGWIEWA
tara:strand:+ start:780 stop:1409 length:630 start_codon:yes stop_codon:yes gene_type:complete